MTTSKVSHFPRPAGDKMPFPPAPTMDLGTDEEAAAQSAQTFASSAGGRGETRPLKYPHTNSTRWHTPLLLAMAAIIAAVFLLATR